MHSIAHTNKTTLVKKRLYLKDAFVGLVHMPGAKINLGHLIIKAIGGDSINFRFGDVYIKRLTVRGADAWIDYEFYHQDICQSYAVFENGYTVNPNGIVRSVTIEEVDIEVYSAQHQIFMLSDGHFVDWFIGTKSLRIRCVYPYWFVANTLENSVIGNADNVDIAFLHPIAADKPKVRIGDGIIGSTHCIKPGIHRTKNVMIIGCGKTNVVPANVMQF